MLAKNLSEAIQLKSGGVASRALLWEKAVRDALNVVTNEDELLAWLEAFGSPRLFGIFIRGHVREGEFPRENLTRIRSEADEASVSTREFVSAIEEVLLFLEKRSRSAKPSMVIGYVSCAAEFSNGNAIAESLSVSVGEMLSRYGFDG